MRSTFQKTLRYAKTRIYVGLTLLTQKFAPTSKKYLKPSQKQPAQIPPETTLTDTLNACADNTQLETMDPRYSEEREYSGEQIEATWEWIVKARQMPDDPPKPPPQMDEMDEGDVEILLYALETIQHEKEHSTIH